MHARYWLIPALLIASVPAVHAVWALPMNLRSLKQSEVPAGLEYFEDSSGALVLADAMRQNFSPVPSAKPSFGYTSSAYWLRFSVEDSDSTSFLIELVSLIDSIDLYVIGPSGGIDHFKTGRMEPMQTRPVAHRNFVFPVHAKAGVTHIYFRFQSSGSMLLPLTLWSVDGFRQKDYTEQLVFGLYFGILLSLALYNLFLFLSVRDASYIYYVLYVISFCVFQAGVWGILHEALPESPMLATKLLPAAIGATIVFVGGFSLEFLRIEDGARWFLLRGLQILGAGVVALAFAAPYRVAAQSGAILGIGAVVVLAAVSIYVMRSFKPARYFVLAFGALFLGVAVIALRNLGVLPFSFLVSYSGQIGSVMEVILLSLALADRINTLKAEKEQAQKQALETQRSMTESFERFVPADFLTLLGKPDVASVRAGDAVQKDLAVLFADIRDFTSMSEKMSPEENFRFINACLKRIGPVIREHGGFVDKYIGDAIMALFPSGKSAAAAAFAIQDVLADYNQTRQTSGYDQLRIGIGIHSGRLMLGMIGEEKRLEGTVISDAVNTAARIESLTKQYGEALLVTRTIVDETAGLYTAEALGSVQLKGKSEPVAVFRLQRSQDVPKK